MNEVFYKMKTKKLKCKYRHITFTRKEAFGSDKLKYGIQFILYLLVNKLRLFLDFSALED